jgi:hypothetical protein
MTMDAQSRTPQNVSMLYVHFSWAASLYVLWIGSRMVLRDVVF